MSYGAISKPAVLALSNGARMAGCWMNTGEGGLSPYHLEGGADIVFQIGTAKYGVRDAEGNSGDDKLRELAAHDQVKMFEIKLSQGAKPGKGGILPGEKVTEEIAAIRGIDPGQDSLSPEPASRISTAPTTCSDMIDRVSARSPVSQRSASRRSSARTVGWTTVAEAIKARGIESAPDFITVDSADGGTGAAPAEPHRPHGPAALRESLPLVVDLLQRLRSEGPHQDHRVSGKLVTPAMVAWALCVGADFAQTRRAASCSRLGCIQALQCNKNTCPTGITTHDPDLQRGLDVGDKTERVYHYATSMRKEVGIIAHSCGVPEPRRLQRFHCRIVQENGQSMPLDELYPEVAA